MSNESFLSVIHSANELALKFMYAVSDNIPVYLRYKSFL